MLNNLSSGFQSRLDATINYPILLAVIELDGTTLYLSDKEFDVDIPGFTGVEWNPWVENQGEVTDNVQVERDFIGDPGTLQSRQGEINLIWEKDGPSGLLFDKMFRGDIKIDSKVLNLYRWFSDSTESPVLIDAFATTSDLIYNERDMKFTIKIDSLIMLSNENINGDSNLKGIIGTCNYVKLIDEKSSPVCAINEDISSDYTGVVSISNGIGFFSTGTILLDNEYITYDRISASTINITGRGVNYSIIAPHQNGAVFFQKDAIFEYSVCAGPLNYCDNLRILGTDNQYHSYNGDYTIVYDQPEVVVLFSDRKPQLSTIIEDGEKVTSYRIVPFDPYAFGSTTWTETDLYGPDTTSTHQPPQPGDILPRENDHENTVIETFGDIGFGDTRLDPLDNAVNIFCEYYQAGGNIWNWKDIVILASQMDHNELPLTFYTVAEVQNPNDVANLGKITARDLKFFFPKFTASYIKYDIFFEIAESYDDGVTFQSYEQIWAQPVHWQDKSDSTVSYIHNQSFDVNIYPDILRFKDSWVKYRFRIVVYDFDNSLPFLSHSYIKINSPVYSASYKNQGALEEITYYPYSLEEPEIKYRHINFDKDMSYLGDFVNAELSLKCSIINQENYSCSLKIEYQDDNDWNLIYGQVLENSTDIEIVDDWNGAISSQQELEDFRLRFTLIPNLDDWKPYESYGARLLVNDVFFTLEYLTDTYDSTNYQYSGEMVVRCVSDVQPATPPNIIKHYLTENPVIEPYVDINQFNERHNYYAGNNYYLNGQIDNLSLHDAIKKIMTEGFCRLKFNQGKIQLTDIYDYKDQSIDQIFTENNTAYLSGIQQNISNQKRINNVEINYNKDWLKDEYLDSYQTDSTESIIRNNKSTFAGDYELIDSTVVAEEIGDFIIQQRAGDIFTSQFESFLNGYTIEKGDTIAIEHLGGWQHVKVVNVLQIYQDAVNSELNIYQIKGIQKGVLAVMTQYHSDLQGLEGGNNITQEYYHITETQFNEINNIINHVDSTNNPHNVTKNDIGLGNAENTSDLDKPISTATQNALDDLTGGGVDSTVIDEINDDISDLTDSFDDLYLSHTLLGNDVDSLTDSFDDLYLSHTLLGNDVDSLTDSVALNTTFREDFTGGGEVDLPLTNDSTTGIIYKDSNPQLHDFHPVGSEGQNVFLGNNCGSFIPIDSIDSYHGTYNIGIGSDCLSNIETGQDNIGIGTVVLNAAIDTEYCYAIGSYSLECLESGTGNVTFGYSILEYIEEAEGNVAIGHYALNYPETSCNYSTAVGNESLIWLEESEYNTAVGANSGESTDDSDDLTYAYNCTFIGAKTRSYGGYDTTATNQTVIGYGAVSEGNNTVTIGNDDIVSTHLRGNLYVDGTNVEILNSITNNRININNINDLPAASDESDGFGTCHHLINDYTYYINNDITLTNPIRFNNNEIVIQRNSTLTYSGTGALFRADNDSLRLIGKVAGSGTNNFIDFQGGSTLTIDDAQISNFYTGTIDDLFALIIRNTTFASQKDCLTIDNIDLVYLNGNFFNPGSQISDSLFCIGQDVVTADVSSSKFIPVSDPVMNIDSNFTGRMNVFNCEINLSYGGTAFASNSLDQTEPNISFRSVVGVPDSQIIGSFYMERNTTATTITDTGEDGQITSFTDQESGTVRVNSTAHGLSVADIVWILDGYYNGKHTITNVSTDYFDISTTYEGTSTGIWETNQVKVAGATIASQNERCEMTDDNELTFSNLESEKVEIIVSTNPLRATTGVAKEFEFCVMKNDTRVVGSLKARQMTDDKSEGMLSTTSTVEDGDIFSVYTRNLDDTSDVIMANLTMVIK